MNLRTRAMLAAPLSVIAIAAPAHAQSAQPPAQTPNNKTITVTGTRQTYTNDIDRRTYDIRRDVQGATGSIADVLRNIPSVDVDLNGNVSLRGDANVTILVDGKPTSLFRGPGGGQTLQQVPASQYERVEVMTNPSAAFSANGTGGVINLISRRNRAPGLTGSVRAAQSPSGRRSAGGNLSDKIGKLTLTADANGRRDPQYTTDIERFQSFDAAGNPLVDSRQTSKGVGKLHLWTARVGADYDLDPKTRLSAEFHRTDFRFHSHIVTALTGTNAAGTIVRQFGRDGRLVSNRSDSEGSISYRHDFATKGRNVTASLSWEETTDLAAQVFEDTNILPAAPSRFDNLSARSDLRQLEAKLDYVSPLPGQGKLQAGIDIQDSQNRFDDRGGFGADAATAAVPQPGLTDLFHFARTVTAAYATYQRPIGDLAAQFGLRVEGDSIDLNPADGSFLLHRESARFFPSLHVERAFGDNKVQASYSTRIQRPEPRDLNPFRRFIDPFHIQAGNPALKAQTTQSFELGFEHRKGTSLDLATLYYRVNRNGVTDVTTDIGNDVLLTTRANLTGSRSAGVELVFNGKVTKRLSYRLSGNFYWYEIDAANLGYGRRSTWVESGKASFDWQPNDRNLAQINISAVGKRLLPQGHVAPFQLVNVGFRHKLNRRLWVFVTAQDALHTYQIHSIVRTPTLIDRSEDFARTRAAFLGITYNFGGKAGRDPAFDFSG